ncbi:hypothetical protein NNC19_15700 [Clostridium sp. SHJSY1]|uniref:hypothetical protein n=1 Tax=Clostridium sp. SHJSY1 TaxID=2942483 RepID=UPI00287465AA|nr:hypothetical protein [Clostridium sp. SHJSY1]MDS0527135.1 hypothetical protein [Clostridium sp. SHJSY1]
MLEKDFKANLIKSIIELGLNEDDNIKFTITPITEEGKNHNSKDDYMRLWITSEKNLMGRFFDYDGVVNIFSAPDSRYPLWVTVELKEQKDDEYIIELKSSQRFRTPSVLQNQETGHPPFKVIK